MYYLCLQINTVNIHCFVEVDNSWKMGKIGQALTTKSLETLTNKQF